MANFLKTMAEFMHAADETVCNLKRGVTETMDSLRQLYSYFGEEYDNQDPAKILAIISSFIDIFAKAVADLQVRHLPA